MLTVRQNKHCLQALKMMHPYDGGGFDWLISRHQGVIPWREAISIMTEKYKRFTFVHPVVVQTNLIKALILGEKQFL